MESVTRVLRFSSAVAMLALLCAIPSSRAAVPSPAESYAEVRKVFQEAYARASTSIVDSGANDSDDLKSYPLYPYLQAARIQQALSLSNGDSRYRNERMATSKVHGRPIAAIVTAITGWLFVPIRKCAHSS